jgi:hypothetical protein
MAADFVRVDYSHLSAPIDVLSSYVFRQTVENRSPGTKVRVIARIEAPSGGKLEIVSLQGAQPSYAGFYSTPCDISHLVRDKGGDLGPPVEEIDPD